MKAGRFARVIYPLCEVWNSNDSNQLIRYQTSVTFSLKSLLLSHEIFLNGAQIHFG